MPRIPGVNFDQAVRSFEQIGYRVIRQGKHIIMPNGITRLTIPRNKPINPFTMGAIARDADLTPQEFRKLL